MGDRTGIEWTDATSIVDRGGRRTRLYRRKDATRPGQQIRRRMLAAGLRWCRHCRKWKRAAEVTKSGLCRPHENADYRRRYAAGGKAAIAPRVHARRRDVAPLPLHAVEHLLDQCGGRCVYCGKPADTWDHVVPISRGGQTVLGNVVPACRSCNSTKRDRDLDDFLNGRPASGLLVDLLVMPELIYG